MARVRDVQNKMHGKRVILSQEILGGADVICTTCLSAGSRSLKNIDFPMVFLDEASMATEPLSLIPLTKGVSCKTHLITGLTSQAAHVAIIGDHKQLPPVIISADAREAGLSTSLFERLIHESRTFPIVSILPPSHDQTCPPSCSIRSTGCTHPSRLFLAARSITVTSMTDDAGTTLDSVHRRPPSWRREMTEARRA